MIKAIKELILQASPVRTRPLIVIALLSLLCCSACSRTIADRQYLNLNLGFEPGTLDWNLATDQYSFDVISNIMVGLTRFDQDEEGNIISVPGCAKSWEVNEDSSEFTFHLDPEAHWTDAEPVIAQHFVDSFNRALDPKTGAPYADLLSMIDLEKTYAIDDLTLRIKLKRPAAYFVYLTSYGLTLPIRKDLLEKYGDKWTEPENIITNGPFKLSSWQHEYKIVLDRNKDFHLYSPQEDEINGIKFFMVAEQASAFTLFKNNQFDWIDSRSIPNSEFLKLSALFNEEQPQNPNPNLRIVSETQEKILRVPLLRNTFIGFNTQKKPFSDKRVRKAFSYAINREQLVKVMGRGDVANATWIPPGLPEFFDFAKGLDFDVNKARNLLAAAGYANRKDFPEIEFLFPSTEISKLLAETLQSMWKEKLGITVKLTGMEWKVFLDTLNRNPPDLYRLNWGADYPDPDTFMQLFSSTNRINYGKWINPEYDSLVKQAASITNVQERKKLYQKAEKLLLDEEMAIAPVFVNTQLAIEKANINKLTINPMDIIFLDKASKGAL